MSNGMICTKEKESEKLLVTMGLNVGRLER
jgi:hypothetical protein